MFLSMTEIDFLIDDIEASEKHQSNSMLHLAMMLARFALAKVPETFRDEACASMIELVRAKRKNASSSATTPEISPRPNFEHRKPWLSEVHQVPLAPLPAMTQVSAKFGSG